MNEDKNLKHYRSAVSNLTVGFSTMHHREDDGQKVFYPKLSFKDFGLVLDTSSSIHHKGNEFPVKGFISLLERHDGNRANGGDSFWEESESERAMLRTGGFYAQIPPDGITKEDEAVFKWLDVVSTKMTPPQKDQVFEKVDYIFERFKVVNQKKPNKLFNMRRMKSWIILFLGNLEDVGIINQPEEGD